MREGLEKNALLFILLDDISIKLQFGISFTLMDGAYAWMAVGLHAPMGVVWRNVTGSGAGSTVRPCVIESDR